MNQELKSFSESLEWHWPTKRTSKTSYFTHVLPALVTGLPLLFPDASPSLYILGKIAMIYLAWPWIKKLTSLQNIFNIDWKTFSKSTLFLSIPAISFILISPYLNIDTSSIKDHLQTHQLGAILLPMIAFLCVFNSALEETYFRGYLLHTVSQLSIHKQALINAISFIPHHLLITLNFFELPLALLLSFSTGVAAWVWTYAHKKGLNITGLWLSHFILDIIVIYGATLALNIK